MRRHPLLMLCAIAALLVSGGSAGAAGAPDTLDFGVAPSKLQMKLIPGQVAHTDIDIVNKGDKPLTLDAYFNDYTISSASDVQFKPPATLPGSAAPWSSLDQDVLKVPANATVPRDADDPRAQGRRAGHPHAGRDLPLAGRQHQARLERQVPAGRRLAAGRGRGQPGRQRPGHEGRGEDRVGRRQLALAVGRDPLVGQAGRDRRLAVPADGDRARRGAEPGQHVLQHPPRRHRRSRRTSACPAAGKTIKAPTYTILPDSTRTIDASWTPGPVVASGTADVKLYYNDTSALTAPQAKYVVVPWHLILTGGDGAAAAGRHEDAAAAAAAA